MKAQATIETLTACLTAAAFCAFVVDIFTDGGIRRAIRSRLLEHDEPATSKEHHYGVASGAEAILKGATP